MATIEDASGFRGEASEVFSPSTEAEVVDILHRAVAERVPVTIGGGATGVTGGGVPQGGWLLSMRRMNRVDVCEGRAVTGPGAPLSDLHAAAARTGQFYPPDPTEASAAVGGTIANNASGSRSFRYGDTRRHVLRLRVALMDGRVIDVRRGDRVDFDVPSLPLPATTKHTAGYRLQPAMDWIDLFVGSEGTLGVVTEAELRLLPAPSEVLAGVVFFPDDDALLDALDLFGAARMVEYFDEPSLTLLRVRFTGIPAAARGAILFEAEGDAIDEWSERLGSARALLDESWFAAGAADRERFRRFRHALPELVNETVRRNGFLKLGSDYAVPPARNREMMAVYRQLLEREFPGRYVVFGHIGDAHVHANILPQSAAEFERGKDVMLELACAAVALGGTVSAEHGLGKRKRHLLELQYTREEIDAMKRVKRWLDPDWLLGKGTLFADET